MLTSQEIRKIHNSDVDTLIQIVHECAEALGAVSVNDYSKIMNIKKRTVYKYIETGKIKFVEFVYKIPCINANL